MIKFHEEITRLNINRGRLFAIIILLIETTLFLTNLYFINKPISLRYNFQVSNYALMYLILFLISCIYLGLFTSLKNRIHTSQRQFALIDILMTFYITLIMTWSAVISLFDQRLYGSVAAFLTALIMGSLIFNLKGTLMCIPYIISLTVFMVGLPYFQPSLSIQFGHYVNVSIFAILSWVMARTLYSYHIKMFLSRQEVDKQNQLLENEIVLREMIQRELENANHELEHLSLIDDLTGIPNRRNLDNFLNSEWKRAVREDHSISLLMIDIDFFKAFNDNYGHLSGDDCLIRVAQTLNNLCRRSTDFAARLGGEEFLFVAINTDEEGTRTLAENILNSIQALKIPHQYSETAPYLTISVGMTICRPSKGDVVTDCINRADRALYHAKLTGRNRISSGISVPASPG